MRKVDRLFEILQMLRGQRLRTAEYMAKELGVSVRTVYRDIQGLMASGIPVEGERGMGYWVQQPIELPPLQFTQLELQALRLGADVVGAISDEELHAAAQEASVKINAVLPATQQHGWERSPLNVYFEEDAAIRTLLSTLREACDHREFLEIAYSSKTDEETQRLVRPLSLEYWGKVWTCTTYCELRQDFRAFRVDHIQSCRHTNRFFKEERGKTYRDFLRTQEVQK